MISMVSVTGTFVNKFSTSNEANIFGFLHVFNKDLLTKEQYSKNKNFTNNDDITIRKVDKGNTFDIMNKPDYNEKIETFFAGFR